MKRTWILIVMFISMLCKAQGIPDIAPEDLITDTALIADQVDTNTSVYDLIQTTFSSENNYWAIDAPGLADECTNHKDLEHISTIEDVNRKVFKLSIHSDEDFLGCNNNPNIQRTEIKVHPQSKGHQKGTQEETHSYSWSFKIPQDFSPSTQASYLHRIRSISANGIEQNLITLNATIKNGAEVLELAYTSPATNELQILTEAKLSFLKGRWINVVEVIKYDIVGRYQIMLIDENKGQTLLSTAEQEIITWNNTTEFMGPSWGIYRFASSSIQDEDLLYGNIFISEYQPENTEDIFFPIEEAEEPEEECLGIIEYRDIQHSKDRGFLYDNPYYKDKNDQADKTGIPAWHTIIGGFNGDLVRCNPEPEGGKLGQFLTYLDIRKWNKNNPCLQINYPKKIVRNPPESNEEERKYTNPYARKRGHVLKERRRCWMTESEVREWNSNYPFLKINIPEIPREEIPNEELPEDDDLDEDYYNPEDENTEGDPEETVFYDVDSDLSFVDISTLDKIDEVLDIGHIEEAIPEWNKKDRVNKEKSEGGFKPGDGERDENGHVMRSDKKRKWFDLAGIAEVLKSILQIPAEIIKSGWVGYYDPAGSLIRINEKREVENYKKQTQKTTGKFLHPTNGIGATTFVEELDRKDLNIDAGTINFTPYRNSCDSYLSPYSKEKCVKRVDYLEKSLLTVNNVIFAYDRNSWSAKKTKLKTTTGQAEQIHEKYTAIQNKIYQELREIKSKAEKEGILNKLKTSTTN